jgi:TonB family protein
MSPTAKDFDVTNPGSTAPGARPASVGAQGDDVAGKPQPVPLEVPVTVNGARTVEGSDKREPFSETTQTVLVFGNGAVIRLASTVAAGQLLFLTNDKTKKEVVCQVVKSKNYRNVSGYVELEFTEAVPGFWGMRFPGERAAVQPGAPVLAATTKPVAPAVPARRMETPAAVFPTAPIAAPPARTDTIVPSAHTTPDLSLPRTPQQKPVATFPSPASQSSNLPASAVPNAVPPKAPGLTDGPAGLTSTARLTENKPPVPVTTKTPAAPVNTQASSSDALRRESERLQEQLASMLFAADVPAKPVQAAPVPPPAYKPPIPELSAKVVEIAKPQTPAAKVIPPPKIAPVKLESSLDAEEIKIPSWLEPLARNAATHGQNEIAVKEEHVHSERVLEFEVQDVSAPPIAQKEEVPEPAEPSFETHFTDDASAISSSSASQGFNKVVLLGAVAAAVLLAIAGGTWYARKGSAPAQTPVAAVTVPATAPSTVAPAPSQPPARQTPAPTPNRSNINSEPVAQSQGSPSQANSQSAVPEAQLVKVSPERTAAELSAYKKLAEPQPQPAVKKPSLGEVHFAAPKANRSTGSSAIAEADAGLTLNANQVVPTGDALSAGLGGDSKQPVAPAAPLPIGGDVRPARLIASTSPVYPPIAKNQRIEGAVRIDALIDANGKVSSMKIVSGPVLLHQSAMDALRNWKYQAATLDGKPVPMHLTVTLQFRLQ